MNKTTSKEFAEKHGVDPLQANAILNFLVAKGQAKLLDEKRKTAKIGRAANVYEVPETVMITL